MRYERIIPHIKLTLCNILAVVYAVLRILRKLPVNKLIARFYTAYLVYKYKRVVYIIKKCKYFNVKPLKADVKSFISC